MTRVLDGAMVFRWRDTYGLPFDLIIEELRRLGLAFSVPEYVQAAVASQNFTRARVVRDFVDAGAPEAVLARIRA